MKQSRFSEEQIIGILREQETGIAVAELCRKHGVSSPTFYKWKATFGGMDSPREGRGRRVESARLLPHEGEDASSQAGEEADAHYPARRRLRPSFRADLRSASRSDARDRSRP